MVSTLTITPHPISSLLEINFSDGFNAYVSYELLRVFTPSTSSEPNFAMPLVTNKIFVQLINATIQSAAGVMLLFDDGHQSKLFTHRYLYQLCVEQDSLWLTYLYRLRLIKEARSNQISCVNIR